MTSSYYLQTCPGRPEIIRGSRKKFCLPDILSPELTPGRMKYQHTPGDGYNDLTKDLLNPVYYEFLNFSSMNISGQIILLCLAAWHTGKPFLYKYPCWIIYSIYNYKWIVEPIRKKKTSKTKKKLKSWVVSRHLIFDNPNGLWQVQLSAGLPLNHQKRVRTKREELGSDVPFP